MNGELDDAGWEEIVLNLRRKAGQPGEVSIRGNTREWDAKISDSETYHLSAMTQNGKTRLRLTHDISTYNILTIVFASIGALIASGVLISGIRNSPQNTIEILVGSLLLAASIFTALVPTRLKQKKSRGMGSIFDDCAAIIANQTQSVTDQPAISEEETLRLQLNQGDARD
ncbi:hypothetical protein QPK87_10855 [Kamptonema cortianum]|nr:hypothetical protein [Geitlerinema splendidum]MDK3157073.1 hypothetical protein [Kamptonema cortianum]